MRWTPIKLDPCHQCQKPHDRATNGNIYCMSCTGEDSFQCHDCTEVLKRTEIGFAQKGEPFDTLWCKACCEKPEMDERDGEPVTRTEFWDSHDCTNGGTEDWCDDCNPYLQ